ncbi:hypothetical protein PV08_01253 [Exophiala spinifera]|uniref:Cytochrome P450 n=1 Tax=Exophiala spinifera TaxID=91928 RepID=A0A0D1YZE4_9EURO|nr:uncharacterized protein PV08_01253 [Exophiala spinifera]KIW20676.1 hypothetical protein PV08_01253 [Exophiala spinifera]
MWRLLGAILALVTAGVAFFINLVYGKRREFDGLPQPPRSSTFWGHLPLAGECKKVFPPDTHMQCWANYIRKKFDLGDVFYIDWWPLGPRWLFIADPELASKYVTTGQSLPKSSLTTGYLDRLLGRDNMVGLDGQRWKFLRSIFNPGFSASHLISLVPFIVDSTLIFLDILHEKAKTNEFLSLDALSTSYTIDIIGKIVMETDFRAQLDPEPHPIVTTFRHQIDLMPVSSSVSLDGLNFVREVKIWLNMRKLDALLGAEIDTRAAARKAAKAADGTTEKKGFKERKRSVIELALDAYDNEAAGVGDDKSSSGLNASFRTLAIDSIKTFIFAGHDTTSSTICYTMYLLHLHPDVHTKVVAELDTVYGADVPAAEVAEKIKADPHSINKLEYMGAVIKEVLRLFPPASTLRELRRPQDIAASKDRYIHDPKTGKNYPIQGFHVWPAATMIHRNADYFPDPVKFVPERFLPSLTPYPNAKLHTPAGKDAWRPFEKGPRNCIGQELAMIETKISLALVVKDLDFTPEYDGVKIHSWTPIETKDEFKDGVPGAKRLTIEGHRPYQVLHGAARPRNGMTGRMSLRGKK